MTTLRRIWRMVGPAAAVPALLLLCAGAALVWDSTAAAQSAPGRPDSVTVTRVDNSLNASWDAPAGATKYHVTYSYDNAHSWFAAASPDDNHTATSISIGNADDTKTYVVAVRAGNEHGWSGWRNSAPNEPTGLPGRIASVTVTRADGSLTASWPADGHADKYHVTYSSDGGNSWAAASDNHASTSITISVANGKTYVVAVRAGKTFPDVTLWGEWRNSSSIGPWTPPPPPPTPPAAPAGVTLSRSCEHFTVTWAAVPGATGYDLNTSSTNRKSWIRALSNVSHNVWVFAVWSKDKSYHAAVRARNAHGVSGWTNSAVAHPPSCEASNLRAVTSTTHGKPGGSITTTWDAAERATAHNVNYRKDGGAWQRIDSGVSGATHVGGVASTGGYTVAVQSIHSGATSFWRNARTGGWLTTSGVTASGATLTLTGHAGSWYVKKTAPTAGTCSASAITGTTHTLSTLSAGTAYEYTAYSDSSCATAIASAAFSTGISVSNLSETSTGTGLSVTIRFKEANAFTTGSHAAGYTLQGVVFKFLDAVGSPGSFTPAIHTESGGNPSDSAAYTLSGESSPATAGNYTYTCSGTCSLDNDTTYFLLSTGTSPDYSAGRFKLDLTASDSETNTPNSAGWIIADTLKSKYLTNDWGAYPGADSFLFELIATKNPTLTVSSHVGRR